MVIVVVWLEVLPKVHIQLEVLPMAHIQIVVVEEAKVVTHEVV